jgi:uncharacterized protein YdeI (YjbR/CyaY-like superfamily)
MRLNWTIIRIPFDAQKLWGTRGQLKVRGNINGFAFRTSLFPARGGGHIMLVNKKMQAGARVKAGDKARFRLEPDLEPRLATPGAEFKRAMAGVPELRRWFGALSHSTRIWICRWIEEPKSKQARERRAQQMAERLYNTMEAERELPPMLRQAFARDPLAARGWPLMSATKRRMHLLAVFSYASPDARERRIEKMMQEAAARAEKAR